MVFRTPINITMSEVIQWSTGLNGYKKHTLDNNDFTTELTECQFESGRSVDDIFNDHLIDRPNSPVELLYSGGMDSELVLMSLLRNNIPVEAMTMVIMIKGAILNVVDLYYSEKFCRENNVKQNLFYFDAVDFYESGKYLEYALPLRITEPHVPSHMWLIEQCHNYPIVGGDWPWLQVEKKVLSPFKLAFSSYERFMGSKNIPGIGNMISHSFESSYHFIEQHLKEHEKGNDKFHTVPFLKYKMYGTKEPRIKSYGWEHCPKELFNIAKYQYELLKQTGASKSNIIWGEKISKLIDSTVTTNSLFI
jgi:hypothetical protein